MDFSFQNSPAYDKSGSSDCSDRKAIDARSRHWCLSWKSEPGLSVSTAPSPPVACTGSRQAEQFSPCRRSVWLLPQCDSPVSWAISQCDTGPDERPRVKETGVRIKEEGAWVCFYCGAQRGQLCQQKGG